MSATVRDATSWEALLHLGIERVHARSVLARRRHAGPLVVQKPFYPEGDGIVHLVVIHPPGGIADGDRLDIRIDVGSGAHALLTTPGAAKWYKCPAKTAEQRAAFQIAAGGVLEWLPQETILFDATRARIATAVELCGDAAFAGWDILCFGRSACGERFSSGLFEQRLDIRRDGERVWFEAGRLSGDDPLLSSPLGLAGHPVCGTFVVAVVRAKDLPLAVLRKVEAGADAHCGITLLPQLLVARWLGRSAEQAKAYFTRLWALLRPTLCGREACLPRIWRT